LEGRTFSLESQYPSLGSPRELASEVGPHNDLQILRVVVFAYRILQEERIVDRSWPEDKITRELYVRIQVYVKENGINTIPVHQYPVYSKTPRRGRPPTIDFVFRNGYQESPYLGFECKIIDDNVASSIQEYVNQGMKRFLTGKYARTEKIGGMVAYLIEKEILSCVLKINDKIQEEIGEADCLVESSLVDNFDGLYQSKHKRARLLDFFLIYHVFMSFSV